MFLKEIARFAATLRTHRPAPTIGEYRQRLAASPVVRIDLQGKMKAPLVSIITVVRNAEHTIEKTIRSVLEQDYQPLEYIIVDGSSNDSTMQVINRFSDRISIILSEPDQGIYDAFNKGYALSSGDYIGYLNADDWLSAGQVSAGMRTIQASGADFCFGDMLVHDVPGPGGTSTILRRGDPDYKQVTAFSMPELFQTTWLCNRKMFEGVGLFKTNYAIASDYDWLVRIHQAGFAGAYSSEIRGNMRFGGVSMTRQTLACVEGLHIALVNGAPRATAISYWLPLIIRTVAGSAFSAIGWRR